MLESREAELRLAQARRIPNFFVGPLYKFDNEDQVIGGSINIPLPPFNRNPEEIATALANRDVAHTELPSAPFGNRPRGGICLRAGRSRCGAIGFLRADVH